MENEDDYWEDISGSEEEETTQTTKSDDAALKKEYPIDNVKMVFRSVNLHRCLRCEPICKWERAKCVHRLDMLHWVHIKLAKRWQKTQIFTRKCSGSGR